MSVYIADKENIASNARSRSLSKKSQIKLERQYRKINRDVQKIQECGIRNVIESSRVLRSRLKACNQLSKRAFESASRRCIEYDSEYFVTASETNNILLNSLECDTKTFDTNIFAEKLITLINPDSRIIHDEAEDTTEIDFSVIGQKYSHLIKVSPYFDFIYGTFDPGKVFVPVKARNKPSRLKNIEDSTELKKPRTVDRITDEVTNGKEIENIYGQIVDIYNQSKEPISFFKLLIDPESYSATIENIFRSAFLVKEGAISLKIKESEKLGEETFPVVEPIELDHNESKNIITKKKTNVLNDDLSEDENHKEENTLFISNTQSILSFSATDWRNWIKRFNIESCLIKTQEN